VKALPEEEHMTEAPKKHSFANLDAAARSEVASMGGKAAHIAGQGPQVQRGHRAPGEPEGRRHAPRERRQACRPGAAEPRGAVVIGARLFSALLFAGGLLQPGNLPSGRKVTMWNTRSRTYEGATHDPDRVLRAEAKRVQRRAKVRRAVAAGGYGLLPYVGQKGYVGNTRQGARDLADRLTKDAA
jgi:hypothetical protein